MSSTPANKDEACVRFAYTFSYLKQVNKMVTGVRFWHNLFTIHNLFTCDTDGRRCRCKTFFNGRVWVQRFAELADDVTQLSELIQKGIGRPEVQAFQHITTRMIHARSIYDSLNFLVTDWQACHAAHESKMLESRLCRECWMTSNACQFEAQDLLIGSAEGKDDANDSNYYSAKLRR